MAENEPAHPQQHKPAVKTTAPEPEETEVNENYVGVDPIYANSAYEEPLNPEAPTGKDVTDEEKAAHEAEVAMVERVKENEAACVVEVDEVVPFDEWVESSPDAERKSTVSGVDPDRVEADQARTEEAKNDDGKIPPHSTSTHQPGVVTAS